MSSLTANINNIKAELQENLKNVKTDFQVMTMMTPFFLGFHLLAQVTQREQNKK